MKRLLASIVLLVCALALISCASAPNPRLGSSPQDQGIAPNGPLPYPAAPPAATAAPPTQPKVGGASGLPSVPSLSAERMIVYNTQLGIEVQDTEKAVNDITAIAAQFNGYISATNMSRNSKGLMAGTVTLRIPAESLDAAQKQIESAGLKVLSRNRTSNDVTDQFTDLNARLTNLEATEKELRDLLSTTRERTGKADDILAIYNRLTDIRTQIEQIKGQMNVLTKTSTYATLTISLVPHQEVEVLQPDTWLPNQTAREALRALVQSLQRLIDLGIWALLFILPLVLVFILPLLFLVLIFRIALRRRRTKGPAAAG